MSVQSKIALDACLRNSERAGKITDLIDPMIKELCEIYGYGSVMDSAQRQWQLKDPIGCFTIGPCLYSIRTPQTGDIQKPSDSIKDQKGAVNGELNALSEDANGQDKEES